MTIQAGSLVTIAPPFNVAFPGTYPVIYVFGDGSAAVMVPGWVQEGATFDPTQQGANFAAQYLVNTDETVNLSTLIIPTNVIPPPPGLQIVSTSTPALDGVYPIDDVAQAKLNAVSTYAIANGKFPAGQAQMPWLDVSGVMHLFPTTTLWLAFASAIADFVTASDLGMSPTQPVTIP